MRAYACACMYVCACMCVYVCVCMYVCMVVRLACLLEWGGGCMLTGVMVTVAVRDMPVGLVCVCT